MDRRFGVICSVVVRLKEQQRDFLLVWVNNGDALQFCTLAACHTISFYVGHQNGTGEFRGSGKRMMVGGSFISYGRPQRTRSVALDGSGRFGERISGDDDEFGAEGGNVHECTGLRYIYTYVCTYTPTR